MIAVPQSGVLGHGCARQPIMMAGVRNGASGAAAAAGSGKRPGLIELDNLSPGEPADSYPEAQLVDSLFRTLFQAGGGRPEYPQRPGLMRRDRAWQGVAERTENAAPALNTEIPSGYADLNIRPAGTGKAC